jgi:hypothetical protein
LKKNKEKSRRKLSEPRINVKTKSAPEPQKKRRLRSKPSAKQSKKPRKNVFRESVKNKNV